VSVRSFVRSFGREGALESVVAAGAVDEINNPFRRTNDSRSLVQWAGRVYATRGAASGEW